MEEALKELNAKAYVMTIKEEEVLNQWCNDLKLELRLQLRQRLEEVIRDL